MVETVSGLPEAFHDSGSVALLIVVCEAGAQGEGDVDEADEDRNLDEGSDDAGEGLTGGGPVGGDRDGDGKFEVVACGGESESGGALVSEAGKLAIEVAAAPHDREVGK